MVLLGLAGLNLKDTAHKVLVRELGRVLSKSKLRSDKVHCAITHHTSLDTHGLELGTVHVLG